MMELIKMGSIYRRCDLFGFVVIPNHIHILLQPVSRYTISDYMHYVKRHASRNINILISKYPIPAGEDGHPRLRRVVSFPNKFEWLKSFHDHIIRDDDDFEAHIDYLRLNPIKHGLVKEGEYYPFIYINGELIRKFFDS